MTEKKRSRVESHPPASFAEITRVKCNLEVNFSELSKSYPDFDSAWKEVKEDRRKNHGKSFSSHTNFNFNVSLTRAILDTEFKLKLPSMPKENLVPPVPNRFNYILWIKQLLQESSSDKYFLQSSHSGLAQRGLDLGVGCSAIYPLLLSTEFPTWNFFGTEIDPNSIKCANENIEVNNLQNRIRIAHVRERRTEEYVVDACTLSNEALRNISELITPNERSTPLWTAVKSAREVHEIDDDNAVLFDFVLTNPPFYSTEEDASKLRGDGRKRIDFSYSESIYPGGELGFARDMITDSLIFREMITWYTIMVSKKQSLFTLKKDLLSVGIPLGCIKIAEFSQGKMIRWAIGWTYLKCDLRSYSNLTTGGLQSFQVVLSSNNNTTNEVRDILVQRIETFCSDFSSMKLRCRVVSDNLSGDQIISIEEDEPCTQFAIDCRFNFQNTESMRISNVILQSFAFSSIGLAKVRRLQMLIPGEICQSNRKHRRRSQLK